MKRLCTLIVIALLVPFATTNAMWDMNDNTPHYELKYAPIKKQIDDIFVQIDNNIQDRTARSKRQFYNTLLVRVETYKKSGKTFSEKNTFILDYIGEKTKTALLMVPDDAPEEPETYTPEPKPQETIKWSIDSIGGEYRKYSTTSEDENIELGRFFLEKDTTIKIATLVIKWNGPVNFYKGNNFVKISQMETDYNIAKSTSVEFKDENTVHVYFTSPLYIKEWNYKFVAHLVSNTDIDYEVFVKEIEVRDDVIRYEWDGEKISDIHVKHESSDTFDAGIKKQNFTVKKLWNFIGGFETYGDEFYFKSLELKIDMGASVELDRGKVYILDAEGHIFADTVEYRKDGNIIYITYRNVVFDDGVYQITVRDIESETPVKEIDISINNYQLETQKTIFPGEYFKWYQISELEVR